MKSKLLSVLAMSVLIGCSKAPVQKKTKTSLPQTSLRKKLGQPKQLALGADHSCTLFDSGQVMCWGSSSSSQLGAIADKKIRSTVPHLLPYIVDAIQIDAFADQTCVLRKNGGVVCFGSDGTQKGMRAVQGLQAATSIAVGQTTVCATGPTELWCWGKTKGGQIPGTLEIYAKGAVKLESNYKKINGSESSFFGTDGADWYGWGKNKGNIFRTEAYKIDGFTKIPKSGSFDGLASRAGVVCGWNAKEVTCWAELNKSDSIIKPSGIVGDISKVVLGSEFACALADKNIYCWGENSQGTLGDGTRKSRGEARVVEGLENLIDIDAGGAHVCATTTEAVYCWGNSRSSQLGTDSRMVKTKPSKLKFEDVEGKLY